MVTTVDDLLTPKTADELFADALVVLRAEGLPTTSWQPGSVPRTLLKADSTALADLRAVVTAICKGGFLDDATGDWLTLLAKGVFDLDRAPSVFMQGTVTLTCAAGAGPYTVAPGALLVSDGTRRWRSLNTSNLAVTTSAPASVTVQAESPGDAYNVAGGTVTAIVSPALAGLSASAAAGVAWVLINGTAEESDASLRARCRARWSTLGRGANLAAYEYMATTAPAAPTITRASAVPGSGDGTLTVYVAQGTSAATSPQVAEVQAYIDGLAPMTDAPTVAAASAITVQVIAAIAFSSATYNTSAAHAAITAALTAYINAAGFGDVIDVGRIYSVIYAAAPGIADVDITLPAADTVLTSSQIGAAGSFGLTYTP